MFAWTSFWSVRNGISHRSHFFVSFNNTNVKKWSAAWFEQIIEVHKPNYPFTPVGIECGKVIRESSAPTQFFTLYIHLSFSVCRGPEPLVCETSVWELISDLWIEVWSSQTIVYPTTKLPCRRTGIWSQSDSKHLNEAVEHRFHGSRYRMMAGFVKARNIECFD